jgi:hypothetical protein
MGHALMENRNGLIVGAVTTTTSGHAERAAVLALIEPHAATPEPVTLGADKGYDSADFVMALRGKMVTPHVAQNQNGRRSAIAARPHSRDGGWCGPRCGIADCSRSIGNSPWRWLPMIWFACPNCSPRLLHEVQRTSNRVPLLTRGQFDRPPNPSLTLLPIIAQPRAH